VRIAKETERVTGTRFLESADGDTNKNGKRNTAIDVHSLAGERRRRTKSEWRKTLSNRPPFTNWRPQIDEEFRMAKRTERGTATHSLNTADGRTSENGKRHKASDGHSLAGEHRRNNK
jgi:hypothetical protein